MVIKKTCRFCDQETLSVLFTPNQDKLKSKLSLYACTNCGFGKHGLIVACSNCKLIYVDENTTQEKINTYYEILKDEVYFQEQPAREATFQRYLQKLLEVCPQKGDLLDVGTNTGIFVKHAVDNGWNAIGLEPNRWAAKYGEKEYGITIVNKPFKKDSLKKSFFDVITMWDVIEHFTNPKEEVTKVYWALKDGGVFAFSTVDPLSLLARTMGTNWPWYMEMHRVFLSREAAKRCLLEVGFKKVIFKNHWRFLSLGYFATRLAAIHPKIANISSFLIKKLGGEKLIIPYYANDLYDCYAFK